MLLAITALLSFPFVISHKFSKSRITITKNLFSCQKVKVRNLRQIFVEPIKKIDVNDHIWRINESSKMDTAEPEKIIVIACIFFFFLGKKVIH